MVHGPQKKGEISKKFSIESIFCNLRLPGINWCRSQSQAHKVPAENTLQATCSKLKPELFAGIMLLSGQMKMKCCWSGWQWTMSNAVGAKGVALD